MSSSRAFTLLLCSYLVSCQSQRPLLIKNYEQARKLVPQYERQYSKNRKPIPWLGPPPAPAIRLRRANPTSPALLMGHVDLVLENGQTISIAAAAVSIDKQIVATDAAGNYAVVLPPGRYALRSGGIGFLWSQAPLLRVAAGDSMRLDFRLLSEVRPIID